MTPVWVKFQNDPTRSSYIPGNKLKFFEDMESPHNYLSPGMLHDPVVTFRNLTQTGVKLQNLTP